MIFTSHLFLFYFLPLTLLLYYLLPIRLRNLLPGGGELHLLRLERTRPGAAMLMFFSTVVRLRLRGLLLVRGMPG